MIVVDASIAANAVGDDTDSGRRARHRLAGEEECYAPDLLDVETLSVLRRAWLRGSLPDARLTAAIHDLRELPIARVPTASLLTGAIRHLANLTAYDATYVALAEMLGCPLITADTRLAVAPGVRCTVEVVT